MLDFWASWCGPCLREVPNVKKVYDKFHDKGFEILSVSLDDKKDNWVNAIEKNDLNWGHVSSLKGWSCPVAKLYNVSGVPAMLLIDKEGKIVATKLRGDLLRKKCRTIWRITIDRNNEKNIFNNSRFCFSHGTFFHRGFSSKPVAGKRFYRKQNRRIN